MEIKRYNTDFIINGQEAFDGKWVRYEDHAKLVRDFEQAMKVMDREMLDHHKLIEENNKLKSQIIDLKDKLYQIKEILSK